MSRDERLDMAERHNMNRHYVKDLARGHLRYETLRGLSPKGFATLYERALSGKNFDGLVDDLILETGRYLP